jgi:tetratricopeptide (TPR) repeat protein
MGGRGSALATAALAVIASGRAAAQPRAPGGDIEMEPAVKDPNVARKWLAVGQQLMQRGSYLASRNRLDDAKPQFENAVTAFVKAIEASDDVNLYLELASAEEKLGKLDEATRHVRRVVEAGDGARPDVAKRAASKLDDLMGKVGLVTLSVAPAGTSITLGGAELGTSPLREPLVLMPGTYTLSFQADGFQPREAELRIEAGSETERTIELEPVKVIVEPVKPVTQAMMQVDAPPPPRSKLPLYVGAGVTGAAALAAGVFGILAIGQHATFTRASTSAADREDARTTGKRFAAVADGSLVVATAAAGFTAYWYIYRYRQHPVSKSDHRSDNLAKLDLVPWVQPQSGGMTLAGWF